jgi:hypothetical protein
MVVSFSLLGAALAAGFRNYVMLVFGRLFTGMGKSSGPSYPFVKFGQAAGVASFQQLHIKPKSRRLRDEVSLVALLGQLSL